MSNKTTEKAEVRDILTGNPVVTPTKIRYITSPRRRQTHKQEGKNGRPESLD
jgi:hypothetical protein